MSDALICPECGREMKRAGRTAGQRFPCPWCKAVVDVPVLARTIKRGRRIATPRERPLGRGRETSCGVWASLGGGLLAVFVLAIVVKWAFAPCAARFSCGRWKNWRFRRKRSRESGITARQWMMCGPQ